MPRFTHLFLKLIEWSCLDLNNLLNFAGSRTRIQNRNHHRMVNQVATLESPGLESTAQRFATPSFSGAFSVLLFLLLLLFRAAPLAYGCSQPRGQIRTTASGLHHSHSNTGSEPHLQPTFCNAGSLTNGARPGNLSPHEH